MKKSTLIIVFLILLVTSSSIFYALGKRQPGRKDSTFSASGNNGQKEGSVASAYNNGINFVTAARSVTPAVVHIKTTYGGNNAVSPLERMFGQSPRGSMPSLGSGSGVTIDHEGYIATNNHVVENASTIEVIFPDRRSFIAELVGRDPNTDLALLKVKGSDFPIVKFGNSDIVEVGEPVLAVGYPFSLNTTVTAGIVSAKGRSIGIINSSEGSGRQASSAIESFIQTDAAINPGNSGGALVNVKGELIGINTAIASLTGSYAGYAFAIPVNLADKILGDLKEFGTVKRGMLGVSFPSPSGEDQYLKQQGINPGTIKGVFITGIQEGSAAEAAGLKEGDIIQQIDGIRIYSSAEFSERIARHRPGDKVNLTYLRNGNENTTTATLKEEEKSTARSRGSGNVDEIYEKLGATFSPLSNSIKERLNIKSGVVVNSVRAGGFFDMIGVPAGTIIVYINGQEVYSPADIEKALIEAQNSRVQIFAIAPDGSRVVFNFSLGT